MTALSEDFDLIVVGGGPAGSTLATLVSMNHHRVLLLDRERFPRYQIGESLLPATVHGICVILGVSQQLKQANFVRKQGGTFLWGNGSKPWTFNFNLSPMLGESAGYAYQVERSKFDTILLNNAQAKGVDVRQQHTVAGVLSDGNRITGVEYSDDSGRKYTAKARFVADASGHQTVLARCVGERIFSKFFQNVALFGYFENGKRLPPPNEGNILCASFKDGWFWYIPLSDKLTSVGAVIGREHADVLRADRETAINHLINECPIIQDQLSQATRVTEGPYGQLRMRKDYSYCHSRFWMPGLVLVGDAACFIDPVFSSGVHLATYSALLAARSINTVLQGGIPEERCFDEFERRYRREFGNFYQFLLSFYDTHKDEQSYFWEARKVLNTDEKANEAFLRLVAGVASSGERIYHDADAFLREGLDFTQLFTQSGQGYLDAGNSSGGDQGAKEGEFMSNLLSGVAEIQNLASRGTRRATETPMFAQGLIPTLDGLRWQAVEDQVPA